VNQVPRALARNFRRGFMGFFGGCRRTLSTRWRRDCRPPSAYLPTPPPPPNKWPTRTGIGGSRSASGIILILARSAHEAKDLFHFGWVMRWEAKLTWSSFHQRKKTAILEREGNIAGSCLAVTIASIQSSELLHGGPVLAVSPRDGPRTTALDF